MNFDAWQEKDRNILGKLRISFQFLLVLALLLSGVGTSFAVMPGKDKQPRSFNEAKSDQEAVNGKKYREGELLVKFRKNVTDSEKVRLHARFHSAKVREFGKLRLHHVRLRKGMTVEDAVKLYNAEPDVEYAQPNHIASIQSQPNDPFFGQLWGMAKIEAPTAWNTTTGDSNVILAVIDTGVDYNHPDLTANLWNDQGSFGYNSITQTNDPMDDHGHGTHISGTIAAIGNNGEGVVGVNWNAKVFACKAFGASGTGTESDIIECLQYIKAKKAAGANIVATNNSYSFGNNYSQALYDAIKDQQDILYITAAGNDGRDTDKEGAYPANYKLPNVISVAATDPSDLRAPFSNFGRYSIHIGAPGTGILSTFPNNGYFSWDGTSMATAHVTGLVGLLKAQDGHRDWIALRNLILTGGDTVPDIADNTLTGKRLNAAGAMTCSGKRLFSAWEIPMAPVIGQAQTVSVININCDKPAGEITAVLGNGDPLILRDDGVGADLAANDGIYTGTWTPTTSSTTMKFTATNGSFTISSPPVRITKPVFVAPAVDLGNNSTMCVANASCTVSYSTSGGTGPITWAVTGSLPPGVSLDSSTGTISGVPTTTGNYRFSIEVIDTSQMKDSLDLTITVNEDVRPGWPQVLSKRRGWGALNFSSSPVMADLDGDGLKEIIVVDDNNPDVLFGGQDTLYVYNADGSLRAKTVLPGRGSTPAVADIDNDGKPEILLGIGEHFDNTNPVYAFRADLSLVPNFPAGGYPTYNGGAGFAHSLVVADLDNDGKSTLISVSSPNNGNDPDYNKNIITLVDGNGQTLPGWPKVIGEFSNNDVIPAVADVDGDGKKEIVLASHDGSVHILKKDGTETRSWQFAPSSIGWMSAPVVADLNNDGHNEIIIRYSDSATGETVIGVYTQSGALLPNWPQRYPNSTDSGVSVADLNNDGKLELIFVAGAYLNQIYIVDYKGTVIPGWPVTNSSSSNLDIDPIIADIDNDGNLEVLIASSSGTGSGRSGEGSVNAFNASGNQIPGFPKFTTPNNELRSTPVIGDLDGNGRLDLVQKCEDGTLHVWELQPVVTQPILAWPTRYHDLSHSSTTEARVAITTSSPLPDGKVGIPYQVVFAAVGKAPYTWAVVGNALPAGLNLAPISGVISGTPASAGDSAFTLQVTDSSGAVARSSFTITVIPSLTILTKSLPSGNVSSRYSQTLVADYGKSPCYWTIINGSLPCGLMMNGRTGVISGTPTRTGTRRFTVKVIEGNKDAATQEMTITINAALPDLTISFVAGPNRGIRGKSITVIAAVRNQGKGNAGSTSVRFYLTKDANVTTSDILLAIKPVPALYANSSRCVSATVTVPGTIAAGSYYVGAIVDVENVVAESVESNNAKKGGRITIK
jgi:subtilisin family serine protease